ncbi:MAG: hypothetical protein ACFB9M_17925 [Myxococcota bacterium]
MFWTAIWALTFWAMPSVSEACTLMRVERIEEASHRVYFTRFKREDDSEGRFRACRLVQHPSQDTETYYVTPFRQDSTVIVHPSQWPGS